MDMEKKDTKETIKKIEENFQILDECQKVLEEIELVSNIIDKEAK